MKIVIGGASGVGKSFVGYLSLGNNDIVVVDEDAAKLDDIAKEYDIQPVTGSISNPDIQEAVGMKKADMMIAVTESDEVNLVACQVAYTLFGVPRKIARVDSQYFLNPLWNKLYNEKSLPVDLVITPDIEIASFLVGLFKLPGSMAVYPFLNKELNIFNFRQKDTDIPFMKFSLNHINSKLAELSAAVVMILRGNHRILAYEEDVYLQRRIELWGEGFSFYDLKRLNKGIDRTYEGNNHLPSFDIKVDAQDVRWTYQIPLSEIQENTLISEDDQNP